MISPDSCTLPLWPSNPRMQRVALRASEPPSRRAAIAEEETSCLGLVRREEATNAGSSP
jgi:hypothetical protein